MKIIIIICIAWSRESNNKSVGWMGGWMGEWSKTRFKYCLQQSKTV